MNKKELMNKLLAKMESKSKIELMNELDVYGVQYFVEQCSSYSSDMIDFGVINHSSDKSFVSINNKESHVDVMNGDFKKSTPTTIEKFLEFKTYYSPSSEVA